jgi:hypothetical protein
MMIQRMKKIQFLCGLLMIMQLVCYKWVIPFHLICVFLSIIIIVNQRWFKVIQLQYHYYLIGLYIYRLWVLSLNTIYILQLIYVAICLYIGIMLILFSISSIL